MAMRPEDMPAPAWEQFQVLQAHFLAGLPARWRQICQAPRGAALRDGLHRLVGSAGGYGFDQLSQLARRAEQLAASGDAAELGSAMLALEREVRRLAPP